MVEVFTFASKNQENVIRGVEAGLWAVATASDAAMKGRKTKARKYLNVGSFGLLYCSSLHALTTPFVVLTKPDQEAVVTDVWPEPWVLPFKIKPLGDLSRRVDQESAKVRYNFLRDGFLSGRFASISAAMNITGATVFVPAYIPDHDWELMMDDLCTVDWRKEVQ